MYINYIAWDEITYPFANFISVSYEVCAWVCFILLWLYYVWKILLNLLNYSYANQIPIFLIRSVPKLGIICQFAAYHTLFINFFSAMKCEKHCIAHVNVALFDIFSCDQAALQMVFSVCLSVRPSVCHTFFTMFPSSYHHEIFRSYYNGQKWCPCKRSRSEVKGQGHRGQHPT